MVVPPECFCISLGIEFTLITQSLQFSPFSLSRYTTADALSYCIFQAAHEQKSKDT